MRESKKARTDRAAQVFALLDEEYPDAHCALEHRTPYELAAATILSAQCTDARVNMVTPVLFGRYPEAEDLAGARTEDVEEIIRSTGFFRNKTKSLIGMATAVTERHGGELPRTLAELVKLPGIGRKTANVILGNAFGIDEGVVVDTHVKRLSGRLAFTPPHRSREDRAGSDEDLSAGALDTACPPPDLPRATGVLRPKATLRGLCGVSPLPVLERLIPGHDHARRHHLTGPTLPPDTESEPRCPAAKTPRICCTSGWRTKA